MMPPLGFQRLPMNNRVLNMNSQKCIIFLQIATAFLRAFHFPAEIVTCLINVILPDRSIWKKEELYLAHGLKVNSCSIAQVSLNINVLLPLSAGVTGMCHHTTPGLSCTHESLMNNCHVRLSSSMLPSILSPQWGSFLSSPACASPCSLHTSWQGRHVSIWSHSICTQESE